MRPARRRAGRAGAWKECVVFASGETNAFKRRGTQWRRDEIRFAGAGRPGRGALIDSRRATAGRLRRIGDSSGPIKLPRRRSAAPARTEERSPSAACRARSRGPQLTRPTPQCNLKNKHSPGTFIKLSIFSDFLSHEIKSLASTL